MAELVGKTSPVACIFGSLLLLLFAAIDWKWEGIGGPNPCFETAGLG